jgi:hypothetical protein
VARNVALEKSVQLADGGPWVAKRRVALVALVLGALSFAIVAIVHPNVSELPDWRLSVPGFAAAAIASVLSLVRREPQGYWLWAIGLGLAVAAIFLGWFLMLAIVIAATAIVILILNAVM